MTPTPTNVPALALGEKVAQWRRGYLAATATLTKEEKIAILPIHVKRTKGENEIAHLATKEAEVKDALDLIEKLIDGMTSIVKLTNSFFDVSAKDKDITSLFFELLAAGKACHVTYDLIMIRFCGLVKNGEKFYEDNQAKITSEMTEATMMALFQAAKAKIADPPKVKVEKDYVWAAAEEPPQWANEIRERLDEIERQNSNQGYDEQYETDSEESVNYVNQRNPNFKKKMLTCYICKKSGHSADRCYKRKCDQCKGTGHDKKDCPSGKNNFQRQSYKPHNQS